MRGSRPGQGPDRALARRRRMPCVRVRGRVLVRTVQQVPRPRARRANDRSRGGGVLRRGAVSGGTLRDVALRDLERLAELLRSGSLRAPITDAALLAVGLEHLASAIEWARALPANTITEVLQVLVTERRTQT